MTVRQGELPGVQDLRRFWLSGWCKCQLQGEGGEDSPVNGRINVHLYVSAHKG